MGNNKPEPQVRKPPSDDQADEDKVAAFIEGGDGDEQTSSSDGPDGNEGRETERIAIYFGESTAKRLRMYAAEKGRPMSRIVDDLVAGELEDWSPDF